MSRTWAKFFCVAIILACLLSNLPTAQAAANYQINYQGKLTDASGSALTGSYDMVFQLYTVSSAGSAVWTETRSGANTVTVTEGLFSVMLGSVTALTSVDFDQTLYLGVTVGADSEMTPRKSLGAVPAAFVAKLLSGTATSSVTTSANAAFQFISTASSADDWLIENNSGTFRLRNSTDSRDDFSVNNSGMWNFSGNLGVGTSTPNWSLQVASTTPYLAITDTDAGTNAKHWLISNQNGLLQIGTSTDALNATSTYFTITSAGRIGVATSTPVSTFTVVGSACVSGGPTGSVACNTTDGTISAQVFNTADVDLSENYPTTDIDLVAGEIVALDVGRAVAVKRATIGAVLLGVVSTAPGVLLGGAMSTQGDLVVPIALAGRVPVNVNDENGPIVIGDRIALSSVAGVGTKATSTSVTTIGTALQPFDSDKPGQIVVFVDLRGAADPVTAITQVASNFRIDENGKLVVKELHAEKLCLGDTCIGEDELKDMLRRRPRVTNPDPEPEPEPESQPEPEEEPTTELEPAPEPTEVVEPVAEPEIIEETPAEVPVDNPTEP